MHFTQAKKKVEKTPVNLVLLSQKQKNAFNQTHIVDDNLEWYQIFTLKQWSWLVFITNLQQGQSNFKLIIDIIELTLMLLIKAL